MEWDGFRFPFLHFPKPQWSVILSLGTGFAVPSSGLSLSGLGEGARGTLCFSPETAARLLLARNTKRSFLQASSCAHSLSCRFLMHLVGPMHPLGPCRRVSSGCKGPGVSSLPRSLTLGLLHFTASLAEFFPSSWMKLLPSSFCSDYDGAQSRLAFDVGAVGSSITSAFLMCPRSL